MKKILKQMLLICVVAIIIVGCGTESTEDVSATQNQSFEYDGKPVKYIFGVDINDTSSDYGCYSSAEFIFADNKLMEIDILDVRQMETLPSNPNEYYKVFGYELSLKDGKYYFVPDNESIFGGYENCILDFRSDALYIIAGGEELRLNKSESIIPIDDYIQLLTEDEVLAYMQNFFGINVSEEVVANEKETVLENDSEPIETTFSDYLASKEIIWLEMDTKQLSGGGNPTKDTDVVGIIITSPDGTIKEARTPISNFGTLGELSNKSDDEIKAIAIDFINDFSNYEMVPTMSDNVKNELKNYISSTHHYTVAGVDINEWRNIKNYLVLAFESTTPEILNYGDMREGFTIGENGSDFDFEFGVKQQNIELHNGGFSNLEIYDSYYAVFSGEKNANGVIVTRVPKNSHIDINEKGATEVLWNPDADIYPEQMLISDTEFLDKSILQETPVKWSNFER